MNISGAPEPALSLPKGSAFRWPNLGSVVAITLFLVTTAAAQQTWWVQSADYGAGNQRQDVTSTLRQRVNGPNFQINSGTMGANPAPGMNKTLRIVARDSAGKVRDFHYKDGAILNTAMFSGAPAPSWGGRPPSWWNGNQPGWGGGGNQPGNNYGLNIVSATWGAGPPDFGCHQSLTGIRAQQSHLGEGQPAEPRRPRLRHQQDVKRDLHLPGPPQQRHHPRRRSLQRPINTNPTMWHIPQCGRLKTSFKFRVSKSAGLKLVRMLVSRIRPRVSVPCRDLPRLTVADDLFRIGGESGVHDRLVAHFLGARLGHRDRF